MEGAQTSSVEITLYCPTATPECLEYAGWSGIKCQLCTESYSLPGCLYVAVSRGSVTGRLSPGWRLLDSVPEGRDQEVGRLPLLALVCYAAPPPDAAAAAMADSRKSTMERTFTARTNVMPWRLRVVCAVCAVYTGWRLACRARAACCSISTTHAGLWQVVCSQAALDNQSHASLHAQ